jgi:peptide/nickel transport system permease protein
VTAATLAQKSSRPWVVSAKRALASDLWITSFMALLLVVTLVAALAPVLVDGNPNQPDYAARLASPLTPGHLAGTDQLGRDVLSRLIYGARVSLLVGFVSAIAAGIVGTIVGLVAGHFGGTVDAVLMRLADVQLSFPFILLALVINAIIGLGLRNIILTLIIVGWVEHARIARGETIVVREREFVHAARLMGCREARIIFRHVLPNILTPLIVVATLQVSRFIVAEASVSFLGFGVQPPTPAWGSMISEGRDYIFTAWWLITFPGVALVLLALSVNMIGDWLRDVLDPKRIVR